MKRPELPDGLQGLIDLARGLQMRIAKAAPSMRTDDGDDVLVMGDNLSIVGGRDGRTRIEPAEDREYDLEPRQRYTIIHEDQ